jgi:hypothetical protein
MKNEVKHFEGESSYDKNLKKVAGTKTADLALQIITSAYGALDEFLGEEGSVKTILATLKDFEPQNAMEARLATQAAVLYEFSMKALRQSSAANRLDHIESMANLGIKLARAHNESVEALSRLRRGGVQQVVVQHQSNFVAGQVQMNTNFTGGVPPQTRGTTPCSEDYVTPKLEAMTTNSAASQLWRDPQNADFMAEKVVVRGLRKACSE